MARTTDTKALAAMRAPLSGTMVSEPHMRKSPWMNTINCFNILISLIYCKKHIVDGRRESRKRDAGNSRGETVGKAACCRVEAKKEIMSRGCTLSEKRRTWPPTALLPDRARGRRRKIASARKIMPWKRATPQPGMSLSTARVAGKSLPDHGVLLAMTCAPGILAGA